MILKLHSDKVGFLICSETIHEVWPKKKGKGCLIVSGLDKTIEVDESLEQIETILTELDIEIVDVAND